VLALAQLVQGGQSMGGNVFHRATKLTHSVMHGLERKYLVEVFLMAKSSRLVLMKSQTGADYNLQLEK
jgi:hypothetical protein